MASFRRVNTSALLSIRHVKVITQYGFRPLEISAYPTRKQRKAEQWQSSHHRKSLFMSWVAYAWQRWSHAVPKALSIVR